MDSSIPQTSSSDVGPAQRPPTLGGVAALLVLYLVIQLCVTIYSYSLFPPLLYPPCFWRARVYTW